MAASPRVIVHLDMDAFYASVEQALNPKLKGRPTVVVQYNSYKGGGIIAVSYEARKYGVKRIMRGDEAQRMCPDLQIVQVQTHHGKADLTRYREASSRVLEVVSRYVKVIEKPSIDEMYLDITTEVEDWLLERGGTTMASAERVHAPPTTETHMDQPNQPESDCLDDGDSMDGDPFFDDQNSCHPVYESTQERSDVSTHVKGGDSVGGEGDRASVHVAGMGAEEAGVWMLQAENTTDMIERYLMVASLLVAKIRQAVLAETGCSCSAGISQNKMLAKLGSQLHKPNQQTIVPPHTIPTLMQDLPLKRIRHLGGKLGKQVQEQLGSEFVGQLTAFSLEELVGEFGDKHGKWLYGVCRGHDPEPIRPLMAPKSIGCSKSFPGPMKLVRWSEVKHWFGQLACELVERLEADSKTNERVASQLTIYAPGENSSKGYSKTAPFSFGTATTVEEVTDGAMDLLARLYPPCSQEDAIPESIGGFHGLGLSATKFVNMVDGQKGDFKTDTPKGIAPLTTYFNRYQEANNNAPELQNEPILASEFTIICDRCSQPVCATQIDEHADMHVAWDLRDSLRHEELAARTSAQAKRPHEGNGGLKGDHGARKKVAGKLQSKQKEGAGVKATQSIVSFFRPVTLASKRNS